MTFRTLVMLCLAAMAGGIMTKGASEASLPSKRSAARHRAAKDSGSGGLLGIIADAVEGLADALGGADEADEADEMEMHQTSLDETDEVETHIASHRASSDEAGELGSDDVDDEDEEDEAEDLSPVERRAWSALRDFYGERAEDVMNIMDRGLAPDASEDDKEAAKEYLDKTAELVGPLVGEADEMEMHKTSLDVDKDEEEDDEMDMHKTSLDVDRDDEEDDEMEMHKTSLDEADEADETEMHKTSLDADKDDEEDEEDEEDMTPTELRALSALQGFYGEDRLEEVAGIVDRGMAPGASEGDKERAQEYLDKAAELVEGADASDATPADKGDEMEMHQTSFDEARADREADEIAEHVVHGVGTIVDAVAPLATELLDAVLGDDEDEA